MKNESFDLLLERKNTLGAEIIFSDGIGSSGKRMLAHVVSAFSRVEKMSHDFAFDYIANLHWMGKLDEDAAIAYLKLEADMRLYHLMIGREVNLRLGESSSIFSNSRRFEYIRRLLSRDGDVALDKIAGRRPILHEAPHDGMRSADLYFDAFETRLKILHIVREPGELAIDLHRRGFGSRVGNDPREFQFTAVRDGSHILFNLAGCAVDLSSASPIEYAVATVATSMRQNREGFLGLSPDRVRAVHVVLFDDLCREPQLVARSISAFLGLEPVSSLRRVFRREGIPRAVVPSDDNNLELKSMLSRPYARLLDQAVEDFQWFTRVVAGR